MAKVEWLLECKLFRRLAWTTFQAQQVRNVYIAKIINTKPILKFG